VIGDTARDPARELLSPSPMHRLLWIVLGFSACTAADHHGTPDAGSTSLQCAEATSHSDLAWIQDKVFSASCTFSGCHQGAATTAGHLSLQPGLSRTQLVGVASTSEPTWKRVVSGDPAKSYLMVAIGHMAGPRPKDGVMPLASTMLCPEKRDAIQRWIEAGAPP
jgi:hypothetical protein